MTPEKRAELEQQLNREGLTVILTRDYDSILLQLARLAQFERLTRDAVTLYPSLTGLLEYIAHQQADHRPSPVTRHQSPVTEVNP